MLMPDETPEPADAGAEDHTPETTVDANEGHDRGTSDEGTDNLFDDGKFNPDELDEKLQSVYKNMQADYTRKMQGISDERKELEDLHEVKEMFDELQENPEARYNLFLALSEEFSNLEEGEDADEEGEEGAFRDPRVDELLEALEEAEREDADARWVAAARQKIDGDFASLEKTIGGKLSEEERQLLVDAAPRDEQEIPDVKAAYEKLLKPAYQNHHERYIKTKDAPGMDPGTTGSKQPDLSSSAKRMDAAAAILEAKGW